MAQQISATAATSSICASTFAPPQDLGQLGLRSLGGGRDRRGGPERRGDGEGPGLCPRCLGEAEVQAEAVM